MATDAKPGAPLSTAETLALTHAAWGLTNDAIALKMGTTSKVVSNHLTGAYVKLRAENRTHAVVMALMKGAIKLRISGAAGDPRSWVETVAVEDGGEAP